MFWAKWASDPWVQFVRYFGIISDSAECSLCSNTVKLEKKKEPKRKSKPIFQGMRKKGYKLNNLKMYLPCYVKPEVSETSHVLRHCYANMLLYFSLQWLIGDRDSHCGVICSRTQGKPVCGSDGRSYETGCELQRARCKDKTLTLAHRGRCRGENWTVVTVYVC